MKSSKLLTLVGLALIGTTHMANAQPDSGSVYHRTSTVESTNRTPSSSNSSSTQTVEERGVLGIKESNVFAPKYKERLNTYAEQIQMGLSKGWLKQDQADHFTSELERLRKVIGAAEAQSYPKPMVDDVDKQLTQFNIDFTNASNSNTPKPAAVPPASGSTDNGTTGGSTTPAKPATATTPASHALSTTTKKTTSASPVKKVTATKKTTTSKTTKQK